MGAGLRDTWVRGGPISCCKTTEYEALGCLHDGQRPTLIIAASMEILTFPSMILIVSIINSLEFSVRKSLSYEFDDRHSMSWGSEGLRISKIN